MSQLEFDLNYVKSILDYDNDDTFGFIYSRTTEDLNCIFDNLNYQDKKILTVLSSSDYLFHLYTKDVASVDTFDINPLTYRYFHLRKWLLNYNYLDISILSIKELIYIVKKVNPTSKEEQDSKLFWMIVFEKLKNTNESLYDALFSYVSPKETYTESINTIKQNLIKKEPVFYQCDIINSSCIKNNYDLIFLSNILDYNRNKKSLLKFMRKLDLLLNKDGSLVCTHIPNLTNPTIDLKEEILLFEKYFQYEELYNKESDGILYYKYTKKLLFSSRTI